MLEGPFFEWYDTGVVHREGEFLKGELHGQWLTHWPDGELKSVCNWSNGAASGLCRGWRQSGALEFEGSYLDNARRGTWRFWDEEGTLEVIDYDQQEQGGALHPASPLGVDADNPGRLK